MRRSPATALTHLQYWKPARQTFGGSATPDLLVDMGSIHLPRFFEEANGHWGIHLRCGPHARPAPSCALLGTNSVARSSFVPAR